MAKGKRRSMFDRKKTRCDKCAAISYGSNPGSKHRKCPNGQKQPLSGIVKGRGIWHPAG